MNALDIALNAKEKVAAERKVDDHALWHAWKADPTPDTLQPLLKRFEPLLHYKMKELKAPNVPDAAFLARGKVLQVSAFKSFNPDNTHGASLNTWVNTNMRPLQRYNSTHANMAYLPEDKANHIGRIQNAQEELLDTLGRQPTYAEIADFVNPGLAKRRQLKPHVVEQIVKFTKTRDVSGSAFENDPVPSAGTREREVIGLLRPALTPPQQEVYDHLYGYNDKRVITSTNELAKALGKKAPQISRLRKQILQKYQEYA